MVQKKKKESEYYYCTEESPNLCLLAHSVGDLKTWRDRACLDAKPPLGRMYG